MAAPAVPLIPFRSTGNGITSPIPADAPVYAAGQKIYLGPDPEPTPEQMTADLRVCASQSTADSRVEQRAFAYSFLYCNNAGDVWRSNGSPVGNYPFKALNTTTSVGQIMYLARYGGTGKGWPWPSWHRGSPGGEYHCGMYNVDTGTLVEPYGYDYPERGGVTWGLQIFDCRTSPGHLRNQQNGKLDAEYYWWSGQANGQPKAGYHINDHEMRVALSNYAAGDYDNAHVQHVVGTKLWRHTPNTWLYPATKTDDIGKVTGWGSGGDFNRLGHGKGFIPMGSLWRLKPSITNQQIIDAATAAGLSGRDKACFFIVAKSWQKYGMTNTDQTGGGVVIIAETIFNTSGNIDFGKMISYDNNGNQAAQYTYGKKWINALIFWATDPLAPKIDWIRTGRNNESEGRNSGIPDSGTYRPTTATNGTAIDTVDPGAVLVEKARGKTVSASSVEFL